jgi:hypothetical protein
VDFFVFVKREFHSTCVTEFPSGVFVDHLYALTVRLTERRMGGETKNNFYLLKTELTSAHQQVESTANSHAVDLRRTFALRERRSPKRRSSFDDSDTSRLVPLLSKVSVQFSQISQVLYPIQKEEDIHFEYLNTE